MMAIRMTAATTALTMSLRQSRVGTAPSVPAPPFFFF